MTPARFGLQTMVVLVLVALVSWPQHRQLTADTFWHADGPLSIREGAVETRVKSAGLHRIGYGSASEATLGANGAAALHRKLYENDIEGRRRPVPAEVLALGGKINGIVGFARTSRNAPIPFARVVLRNLATGAIEARAVADERGRFAFLDVIPSGYVVELVDGNEKIVATSEKVLISVNELRETVVRSSNRLVFASFGGALAPTAREPIDTAVNQGVSRVAAPERCASPPCNSGTP